MQSQFESAGYVTLTFNRNNISSPLYSRSSCETSPPSLPSSSSVYIYPYLSIPHALGLFFPPLRTFFYIYLFPKRPSPPATLYLTFLLNHLERPCVRSDGIPGIDGRRETRVGRVAWERGRRRKGRTSLILLLEQFRNLGRVLLILTE